ncbi:ArgR family transcriptional regulator [Staphylococcus chromogenes]|uniref:ArgR family transcriptional regulator n=1 Tax=Staphylococcus chromogenes TaxID=46126 RepID=UPI001319C671|nr:ArgR family transcriptional regulator [Staphylococcus chromogenes]MCD8904142.1 ArgR family transcriptional regulator [Staphylococcus chromogenes]
MKREERQKLIKMIVQQNCITSKQALIDIIEARFGIHYSLTTIANDFLQLNIHKQPSQHQPAHYQMTSNDKSKYLKMLEKLYNNEVLRISIVNQCILIQSSPGFAQTINFYIDALENSAIVGTISGNDTTMIVTRSKEDAHHVVTMLFPEHIQ